MILVKDNPIDVRFNLADALRAIQPRRRPNWWGLVPFVLTNNTTIGRFIKKRE